MVVDDDYLTLDLMEYVLKPIGGQVVRALNVAEAFKILENAVPDILFLDLVFPQVHGMEFLNYILPEERFSRMRIVVISAHDYVEACRQLGGVHAYLLKPTTARDIRRITQMLLDDEIFNRDQASREMVLVAP